MKIYEQEQNYTLPLIPPRELNIIRGEGATLWDENGKTYLDCAAGHGVASVGHCNPFIIDAIYAQAQTLLTCTGSFGNDIRLKFLQKLNEITPTALTRSFLCNSGTEAIEAALKFARFSTRKTEIIAAMRNFHGRTMGALSATFTPAYRKPFEPLLPNFSFFPYNNFKKLEEKVTENTAAIILEPIQGEGGVYPGEKAFFKKVRTLCDRNNILLIMDEVQTGFCRTGKMFAFEHFDIVPDILCLAKAIAGGLPMGAVVCSENVQVKAGLHGSTFGGNPLSCAAALATIDFMQKEELAQKASEKGRYFVARLNVPEQSKIKEIRAMGLMVGIELNEKVQPYIKRLQELGIIAIPAGPRVLRLLPPLTISYSQLDYVLKNIKAVLS